MKKSILIIALLLATVAQAQQRDRRVELNIACLRKGHVAPDGSIWIATRCGCVYRANSIGSTWRTMRKPEEGNWFYDESYENVVAFNRNTAVGFGNMHGNYMMRTSTGGIWWDTVRFKGRPSREWLYPGWRGEEGRMWAGSQDGLLLFSADSGRTFTTLRDTAFERKQGIDDIYMLTADSGWIAGHGNRVYSTTDNWRSVRRWPTPLDQKLYTVTDPHDQYWVNRVRTWNATERERTDSIRQGHLLVHEAYWTFITPLGDSLHWRRTPINMQKDFEVDTASGRLWARDDSGRVVMMTDPEHWTVFDLRAQQIAGIYQSRAYCLTDGGVVAIGADGKKDTCRFVSDEDPIPEPGWVVSQGNRLWGADGKSVYMLDAGGWYRIARPLGIAAMNPDPDSAHRVIIMLGDNRHYSVGTNGRMEPYTFSHPLEGFVKEGIRSLEIMTYSSGCYHHDEHTIRYERLDGRLVERYNNIDSNHYITRHQPADKIEEALRTLGDRYSLYPTPQDFGLDDTTLDLHEVFAPHDWTSTSYIGYRITVVNQTGDTLTLQGFSSGGFTLGGTRFPWLLPMRADWREASFVTYQPTLWQALKPMMPDGMRHRQHLDNKTLRPRIKLQSGDLLFYRNQEDSDMEKAISESTGKYVHVALVEVDSLDRLWIIEASSEKGVQRRPMRSYESWFDVYRLKVPFDTAAVLTRAKSFVGQPYDNAFLPQNGALYCSELVYESFLDSAGNHLFEAKPMNWRDKKGKLPKYWKKHFKRLKMDVPEGVPGTNPTDMSQSPLLKQL